MASTRYIVQSFVKTLAASTATNFSELLTANHSFINIVAVEVTRSLAGGNVTVGFYKTNAFASLVYEIGPGTGTLFDPEHDSSGTIIAAPYGFVLPYEDEDATDKIHFRINNADTQAKDITLKITYEIAQVIETDGDWQVDGNLKWKSGTSFIGELDHAITANRVWTFPDIAGTIALLEQTNVFTVAQRINAGLGINVAPPGVGGASISGTLIAAGSTHAFGQATSVNYAQFLIAGTFTAGSGTSGMLQIEGTHNVLVNTSGAQLVISGTVNESGSAGNHALLAGIQVNPSFGNLASTVSVIAGINIETFVATAGTADAAGLRIVAAPTGATNNYSLWIDGGNSRFEGNITLAGGVLLADNGTAAGPSISFASDVDIGMFRQTVNVLAFATSGLERVTIDDAGLVGINKTGSLLAQLHVVSGSNSRISAIIDTASAPTVATQQWHKAGAATGEYNDVNAFTFFRVSSKNNGNNVSGQRLVVGRNSNAGAEGPTAGSILFTQAADTDTYMWADNSATPGVMRVNTSPPTGSSGTPTVVDTAGTVVGAQTSWYKLKNNITEFVNYQESLDAILAVPLYSFDMSNRHYDSSLVIHKQDLGSWFSWNDEHDQQIPALNERQLFGYLIASIKVLYARITELEIESRKG